MTEEITIRQVREMRLLQRIEKDPNTTQAALAAHLGVGIGTVNWHIRRMIARGLVKITRLQRRRLRYLITPKGMSEKAELAYRYAQAGMALYRATRIRTRGILSQARGSGYDQVHLMGKGDIAEVCRLTCLEMGVGIARAGVDRFPILVVSGEDVTLEWPPGAPVSLREGQPQERKS